MGLDNGPVETIKRANEPALPVISIQLVVLPIWTCIRVSEQTYQRHWQVNPAPVGE